jgi:hypothetical protein
MPDLNQLRALLAESNPEERKAAVLAAAKPLNAEDKKEVAAILGGPTQGIANVIWLIVVLAVVLVFVGNFAVMVVLLFQDKKVDQLFTIFTTTLAFLTGLLVPSPVSRK